MVLCAQKSPSLQDASRRASKHENTWIDSTSALIVSNPKNSTASRACVMVVRSAQNGEFAIWMILAFIAGSAAMMRATFSGDGSSDFNSACNSRYRDGKVG